MHSDLERVRDIIEATLDLPLDKRADFIRQRAGGDIDLESEVLHLIDAIECGGQEWDGPVGQIAEEFVGKVLGLSRASRQADVHRLGPYRLLRKIGEGGMGAVYLGERADGEFERKVAIKLVREGIAGDAGHHRFRTEERILAGLNHPNIARLFDAAVAERDIPYFVMEYVEGRPITEYCEENNVVLKERLRLFLCVCSAVQYAHQNLVVHRDLKPSNILVTSDGRVKLLDFGIAKVLDPSLNHIATRDMLLTPTYASPEQLQARTITTASDVYSLGVVLFELLTRKLPYSTPESLPTLIREICHQEAPRPSSVAKTAALRDGAPVRPSESEKIDRILRGDLDTIVLRALAKEPDRRYQSAAMLSDDIERYLECKPIRARRATTGYRLQKLIGRHPVGSFLVVVSLAMILAAGAYAHTQRIALKQERDVARREARVATLVAEQLRYLVSVDTLSAVERRRFLRSRVRYLLAFTDSSDQRLRADVLGNSVVGSREVAGALLSLGQTLMGFEEDTLARIAWDHAQRLGEQCCGSSSLVVLETLCQKANHAYCIGLNKDSLWSDFVQRTRGTNIDTTRWNFWRMWAHMTAGRWAEARRFNDVLDHDYFLNVTSKAKIMARISVAHHPAFKRYVPLDHAADVGHHAIDLIPDELHGLSIYPQIALHTAASIELYRGNFGEAEKLIGQYDRLLKTSSLELFRPQLYGMSASLHGDLAASMGDLAAADSLFAVAVRLSRAQSRGWPVVHLMRQVKLASTRLLLGQYGDAERVVLPILARLEELGFDAWPVRDLLVRLYVETDRLEQAAAFTEGLDSTEYDVKLRAWVRFLKGEYEGSESLIEQALEEAELGGGIVLDSIYHAEILADLAATKNRLGKQREALPLAREATSILEQKLGSQHWKTAYSTSVLGGSLARLGEHEESQELLDRGYLTLVSSRGPRAQVTELARSRVLLQGG